MLQVFASKSSFEVTLRRATTCKNLNHLFVGVFAYDSVKQCRYLAHFLGMGRFKTEQKLGIIFQFSYFSTLWSFKSVNLDNSERRCSCNG